MEKDPQPNKWVNNWVLGFMFDHSYDYVMLVKKKKPAWQAGRWNGVGGSIEEGEMPDEAMRREFMEEIGVPCYRIRETVKMLGPFGFLHIFRGSYSGNELAMQDNNCGEEEWKAWPTFDLPENVISNLRWLIPIQLSELVWPLVIVENEIP